MKQLARRALLVVVLLLASVGTASAECAWVLWNGGASGELSPIVPPRAEQLHWNIVSTTDTLTSCRAALQKAASDQFALLQMPYRLKAVEAPPQRAEVP